jgi:hypothetical protein
VFEEDEGVADPLGLTRRDYLSLDAQAIGVGDATELEEMDVHELDEPGTLAGLGILSAWS